MQLVGLVLLAWGGCERWLGCFSTCCPSIRWMGFHILMQLLPARLQQKLATMAMYGPFLMVGLIVADRSREESLLENLIRPVNDLIMRYAAGVFSFRGRLIMRVLSGIQPSGTSAPWQLLRGDAPTDRHAGGASVLLFHCELSCPDQLAGSQADGGTYAGCRPGIPRARARSEQGRCSTARPMCRRSANCPWILSCVTPMGLLQRCHSYKDKIAQGLSPNHGLFCYPVLMAAGHPDRPNRAWCPSGRIRSSTSRSPRICRRSSTRRSTARCWSGPSR